MPRPRSGEPPWEVLSIKLPPAMRHALLLYCYPRQISFGEAIRMGITRIMKEAAVSEAAAEADHRAQLQKLETEKAERDARIAGIERGKAVMAALGEDGLYKLLEMAVPAVMAAAQVPGREPLDRVMNEAIPAALHALMSEGTTGE